MVTTLHCYDHTLWMIQNWFPFCLDWNKIQTYCYIAFLDCKPWVWTLDVVVLSRYHVVLASNGLRAERICLFTYEVHHSVSYHDKIVNLRKYFFWFSTFSYCVRRWTSSPEDTNWYLIIFYNCFCLRTKVLTWINKCCFNFCSFKETETLKKEMRSTIKNA